MTKRPLTGRDSEYLGPSPPFRFSEVITGQARAPESRAARCRRCIGTSSITLTFFVPERKQRQERETQRRATRTSDAMHPAALITQNGSAARLPIRCGPARLGPCDAMLIPRAGARMVLVAAGDRRLANKLFETYKDQMGDVSDAGEDVGEDVGEDARAPATQGDRQKRLAGRSRRGARPSTTAYTASKLELSDKRARYFFTREDGSKRPLTGVHGGGVPQWWALRVNVGREKQTCTNIERRYQQLREAAEAQGEAEGLQEIETWDVWKRVRAWNPKSQKMGNKMVRYEGGGWVLVRAIMDSRIASIISGNINILGYHHREVFEGEEFPVPADSELISALTAWQEDLREITEEEVREELGLGPKPDDVDFDDFEDYGRARGRDSSGSRDRDRGRRNGERSGGLFSSHGSGEAWYGGMSSGDEDRQFDTFDDTVGFGTSEEKEGDAMNEFGAWLGDFKADAGGDDWMGAAMNDEAETEMGIENRDTGETPRIPRASTSSDDLSWWDDADDADDASDTIGVDGGEGASDVSRGVQGGLFTDEESSLWSSSDRDLSSREADGPRGSRALTVVHGEFKDFDGMLIEDGESVIKVEVDVFGLPTVVEIPREDVEFLE